VLCSRHILAPSQTEPAIFTPLWRGYRVALFLLLRPWCVWTPVGILQVVLQVLAASCEVPALRILSELALSVPGLLYAHEDVCTGRRGGGSRAGTVVIVCHSQAARTSRHQQEPGHTGALLPQFLVRRALPTPRGYKIASEPDSGVTGHWGGGRVE